LWYASGSAKESNGALGVPAETPNLEPKGDHQKEAYKVENAGEGAEKDETASELGEKIEGRMEIHGQQKEPLMQEKGGRVCI